jgi:hypothetical protein
VPVDVEVGDDKGDIVALVELVGVSIEELV